MAETTAQKAGDSEESKPAISTSSVSEYADSAERLPPAQGYAFSFVIPNSQIFENLASFCLNYFFIFSHIAMSRNLKLLHDLWALEKLLCMMSECMYGVSTLPHLSHVAACRWNILGWSQYFVVKMCQLS